MIESYNTKNPSFRTVTFDYLEFRPFGEVLIHLLKEIDDRIQDIHNLNDNLERRVNERTSQLETANRELEAFSFSVSHDLRAPLRTISGFSHILIEDFQDQLGEEGRKLLEKVIQETERMGNLINDLLKLSQVSRTDIHMDRLNLSQLAHDAADRLTLSDSSRRVKWMIAPDLFVTGDRVLMDAVMTNLLSNAFKFTARCEEARIEIGSLLLNNETVYFVKDNGAGFDMTYIDKLFGAFQRLHKTEDYPGTGIGLATVQRIINRHGGRVWAESKPGQGAVFYFTLPGIPVLLNGSDQS